MLLDSEDAFNPFDDAYKYQLPGDGKLLPSLFKLPFRLDDEDEVANYENWHRMKLNSSGHYAPLQ